MVPTGNKAKRLSSVNHTTSYNSLVIIHHHQRIVRKQLDIMPTYHYVQNQGKIKMQSQENGEKPQFGQFFGDFEVKYLDIANFLKIGFHSNWRSYLVLISGQKPKELLEPFLRKISDFWKYLKSVWFWANLETILRISPNQEFFSKIRLCDFSTFIVP